MKTEYPNYFQKMKSIEENLSDEDKTILKEYLNFCSLSAGKDKVMQRKRYALQFLDIAEIPFKDFNRKVIEHIYKLIKDSNREIIGKNETIKQLKFFINWLKDDANLIKGINAIPQKNGYNTRKLNPNTLMTSEEIKALINASKNNLKNVAMVSLQTELGLRPCELLPLTWDCIKIEEGVGELKVYSPKTKDTRVLPFQTSVIHLQRWKEAYPFSDLRKTDLIFPHPLFRKRQLYRTYVAQLYRRLCEKAGIRHIYPYLARHTKLTEVNKKCPSKVASAYGGHGEKTAFRYTHLSESDIREVVLKELYQIKEPDIKGRKKLEKEIEELKKRLKPLEEEKQKFNLFVREQVEKMLEKTKKDFMNRINKKRAGEKKRF